MLPISTLKIIDLHLNCVRQQISNNPEKYTYFMESLKQIRKMVIYEFELQSKNQIQN